MTLIFIANTSKEQTHRQKWNQISSSQHVLFHNMYYEYVYTVRKTAYVVPFDEFVSRDERF